MNNSRKNVCLTNPTGNTDVIPTYLPHVSDIIAKLRKTVLGPNCHITLSGLSPAHFPADRCLAGRIVRSLGGILHASLRLPSICNQSNGNDDKNGDNTTSMPVNKLELKSEWVLFFGYWNFFNKTFFPDLDYLISLFILEKSVCSQWAIYYWLVLGCVLVVKVYDLIPVSNKFES